VSLLFSSSQFCRTDNTHAVIRPQVPPKAEETSFGEEERRKLQETINALRQELDAAMVGRILSLPPSLARSFSLVRCRVLSVYHSCTHETSRVQMKSQEHQTELENAIRTVKVLVHLPAS